MPMTRQRSLELTKQCNRQKSQNEFSLCLPVLLARQCANICARSDADDALWSFKYNLRESNVNLVHKHTSPQNHLSVETTKKYSLNAILNDWFVMRALPVSEWWCCQYISQCSARQQSRRSRRLDIMLCIARSNCQCRSSPLNKRSAVVSIKFILRAMNSSLSSLQAWHFLLVHLIAIDLLRLDYRGLARQWLQCDATKARSLR